MPIGFKAFKGLGRRKSNTPAQPFEPVEPTSPTATSSFRVIPRGGNAGNHGNTALDKPLPTLAYRRTWWEEDNSSSNRASDSTSSTTNSRGYEQDNDRLKMSEKIYQYPSSRYTLDNTHKGSPLGLPNIPTGSDFLDMPSSLDGNEDFGNLFEGSGSDQRFQTDGSRLDMRAPASGRPVNTSSSPNTTELAGHYTRSYTKTPPPLHIRQNSDLINASPYSLQSRNSNDGLLVSASPSPTREFPPPPPPHKSPPKQTQPFDVMRNVISLPISDNAKTNTWSSSIIRRTDSTESFTRSGAEGDSDAKMVRNSVLARRDTDGLQSIGEASLRQTPPEPGNPSLQLPKHLSHPASSNTSKSPSLASSASSLGLSYNGATPTPKPMTPTINNPVPPSNDTTPRAKSAQLVLEDSDSDDEPLARTLHRISSNPRLSMMPPNLVSSRLFTTSQDNPRRRSTFDNLRSVSGMTVDSTTSQEDSSMVSDDSQVRSAHAQGYSGQKDRKSGETSLQRPRLSMASQSAPMLSLPNHSRAISGASKSSEDDDDDVPLALLPATNSPSRGMTPDPRYSQQSFIGQGRLGGGLGAPSTTGTRPMSSLPPFARRLPHDPYTSAASVMSASRESLMLSRPAHMFPPGQSPVPGMPPGGLVGVIAEEERSKSWRRAGGQAQMGPSSMNAGMSMGMGGPTSIPGLGSGLMGQQMMPGMAMAEQTQFNQHLVHLVQQQSMMLQQMQAMMQQHQVAQSVVGYAEPEHGQHVPGSPGGRPISLMSQGQRTRSMVNLGRPANAPRTMSMMNTNSPFNPTWAMDPEPLMGSATSIRGMANGYAASVAPSERSTIGQPNRYRPVTNPQVATDMQSSYGGYNRSSMANLPPYGPSNTGREEDVVAKKKKSGFFQAMIHPRGRNSTLHVEEEEDWSNFANKRRSAMPHPS